MSADELTWSEVHEIAFRLFEAEPDLDPVGCNNSAEPQPVADGDVASHR